MRIHFLVLAVAGAAWSQEALTVGEAVARALKKNGAVEASAAGLRAAEARVAEARGAFLPRVNYTESWTRSDNPVFVFGSLLSQRQFGPANFEIDALNRPPFLNNFQSQVVVDQVLYEKGARKSQVRSAELSRSAAGEDQRRSEMGVIAEVIRAYYAAILGDASLDVALEAVRSAEADLQRAETRRAAGVITDADVMSLRVHFAAMREREIRERTNAQVARAALNHALGEPLDSRFQLTTALQPASFGKTTVAEAEGSAAENRPESRQAKLAAQIAGAQSDAARAALWPEFFARAAFEADRQRFVDRGGANFMLSAGLRWNLFDGFANRARVAEAAENAVRARAQARSIESAARLDARRARLELDAAEQRIAVAQAAVDQATEGLRIIRNRYEGGLAEITELLRSETALVETKMRHLEAVRDQRLASVAMEFAAGRLTKDSEVVTR